MKRLIFFTLSVFLMTVISSYGQSILGVWQGNLSVMQTSLPLVLHLDNNDKNELVCTLDSPNQKAFGIPAEASIIGTDSLYINISTIGASFHGKLIGEKIKGIFKQTGYEFPLELLKYKKNDIQISETPTAKLNRPQTPNENNLPYKIENISFRNTTDSITLSGTLTYPVDYKSTKKYPIVVFISGSGLQNRNEEIFEHKPFFVLADYLAKKGIASLRYDDRGFGSSTSNGKEATTYDFARDAICAIDYLKSRHLFNCIGIIGHSEGGSIAFLIASKNKTDFIVSLAGMAMDGITLLTQQNRNILSLSNPYQNEAESYAQCIEFINKKIVEGISDRSELTHQLETYLQQKHSNLSAQLKNNLYNSTKLLESEWYKTFLQLSPIEWIRETKCPVLAMNGTLDFQVNAKDNLQIIKANLPATTKKEIKALDGLNHLFQHAKTGSPEEYVTIEETFSPEAMEIIAKWILSTKK